MKKIEVGHNELIVINSRKLSLNKQVISRLNNTNPMGPNGIMIPGGTGAPLTLTIVTKVTQTKCDLPTIGHDDGPYCVSATDFICWCGGI